MIIVSRKSLGQDYAVGELDQSHYLLSKTTPKFIWYHNCGYRDLARNNSAFTVTGAVPGYANTRHGIVRSSYFTGSGNFINVGRNVAANSLVMNCFIGWRPRVIASTGRLFSASSDANYTAHLASATSTSVGSSYGDNTGTGSTARRTLSGATTITDGVFYNHAIRFITSTTGEIWEDGKSLTVTPSGTGGAYNAGSTNGNVGRNFVSTALYGDQEIAYVVYLQGDAGSDAAREFTLNPWGLIKKTTARIYSFPSAGAASPKWPTSLMLTGTGF